MSQDYQLGGYDFNQAYQDYRRRQALIRQAYMQSQAQPSQGGNAAASGGGGIGGAAGLYQLGQSTGLFGGGGGSAGSIFGAGSSTIPAAAGAPSAPVVVGTSTAPASGGMGAIGSVAAPAAAIAGTYLIDRGVSGALGDQKNKPLGLAARTLAGGAGWPIIQNIRKPPEDPAGRAALALASGGISEIARPFFRKKVKDYQKERWGNLEKDGIANAAQIYAINHPDGDDSTWDTGKYAGHKWTMEKALDLAKEDPRGFHHVLGNYQTFGNDYGSYDEQKKSAIVSALVNEGLYKSHKGDVLISDQKRAREIRDRILSGQPMLESTTKPESYNPPGEAKRGDYRFKGSGLPADVLRNLAPGADVYRSGEIQDGFGRSGTNKPSDWNSSNTMRVGTLMGYPEGGKDPNKYMDVPASSILPDLYGKSRVSNADGRVSPGVWQKNGKTLYSTTNPFNSPRKK